MPSLVFAPISPFLSVQGSARGNWILVAKVVGPSGTLDVLLVNGRARLQEGSVGYSLHAATRIEAEDRDRLERLVRYVARPALAQGRLEVRSDGKIKWSLPRPWRDGTRAFVFDPMTFLERLVALVPHPREHQLTYFGVLAPASPLRDAVVPARPQTKREPDTDEPDPCTHAARRTWAQLLKRTFGIDVLRCPRCGGRRHQIATITDPLVARKILAHLRMRCEPPALAPARHSLQLRFE